MITVVQMRRLGKPKFRWGNVPYSSDVAEPDAAYSSNEQPPKRKAWPLG